MLDEKQARFLEANAIELFASQAPDERDESFATLIEAIEAHDDAFKG